MQLTKSQVTEKAEVKANGQYNATPLTLADGDFAPNQTDVNGNTKTVTAGLDVIREKVENLTLAAGVNNLDFTVVPVSKKDNITNIAWSYTGTVTGVRFELQVLVGATAYTIYKTNANPVSGDISSLQVNIPLTAADKIRVVVSGATLNDDATAYIIGQRQNG